MALISVSKSLRLSSFDLLHVSFELVRPVIARPQTGARSTRLTVLKALRPSQKLREKHLIYLIF